MSDEIVQESRIFVNLICRPEERTETYEKLKKLLVDNQVEFEELVHVPCKTSAEVCIEMRVIMI